ncbi:L,D-transpeptidase [Bifidobacterium sp. MA2]|uniref:L,D-transpeptidase n=1 Tax=Bifidobacterium santillanense TaxID=2809028 RepID=A0ABS5UM20_9BIFI|nr:L,D-transpeptidase [Bifidobacterium santillanense]MBT1171850.1 L,D-transpeptidase [Bifidobacterium santillanense]
MSRHSESARERRRRSDSVLAVRIAACAALAVVMCVAALAWSGYRADDAARVPESSAVVETAADRTVESGSAHALTRAKVPSVNAKLARERWMDPTGGEQPDLSGYRDLSVEVSIARQRVYVKSAGRTVYTMIVSTGADDTTPRGSFTLGVRGDHFYNPEERMGADYWVRIQGPYLFHSVPTGEQAGRYLEDEAAKLGRPASHGCVRLSVADAKWFYDQVPTGTPVTIV